MAPTSPNSNSRLSHFPRWINHWLGYRSVSPTPLPKPIVWTWAFLGAFIGLSVVQCIFVYSDYFTSRNVPGLIASYGASAVLCYNAIDSPLAQPRALIGGHFVSALVGVCITKLFALIPSEQRFQSVRWLAASLSTSSAIVLMAASETIHPPAGATALLPAIDDNIFALGWYFLPIVLLSSAMVLATAMLVNNIQRRYPVFWIKANPAPLPSLVKQEESSKECADKAPIANGGGV